MISVDYSLFIQIANFLLLILLLNIFLYKPIRKILIERKNKIDSLQKDINQTNNTSKEKEKAVHLGLKEAQAEGFKLKEKLTQEAQAEEKKQIAEINEKAKKELENTKVKVAQEIASARQILKNEVDIFAKSISEKLLGRAI